MKRTLHRRSRHLIDPLKGGGETRRRFTTLLAFALLLLWVLPGSTATDNSLTEEPRQIVIAALLEEGMSLEEAQAIAADDELAEQVPVRVRDEIVVTEQPTAEAPTAEAPTAEAPTAKAPTGCRYNVHNFRTYENVFGMDLARFNMYSSWCWTGSRVNTGGGSIHVSPWIAGWAVGWSYDGTIDGTPRKWRLAGGEGVAHYAAGKFIFSKGQLNLTRLPKLTTYVFGYGVYSMDQSG